LTFGEPGNKLKYNGIEYDSSLGVDEYEAFYRDLDPQIGRWWQIDPKIEDDQFDQSPYASMDDQPERKFDPLGDAATCCGFAAAASAERKTQQIALAVELIGGGPEDPVADVIAGGVEVIGNAVVLIEFLTNSDPKLPAQTKTDSKSEQQANAKAAEELKRPLVMPADAKRVDVKQKTGSIYKVPGSATPSGKPYIGRHNKPNPAKTRRSNDGRDRKKAEVIDNYDPNNPQEGRQKEQKAIDDHDGIDQLDNKRNEIKKDPTKKNNTNGS
jgi:RHS repeat-associated protein